MNDCDVINLMPEEFVKLMAKSLAWELTTTDIDFLREFLPVMIEDMKLMDRILNIEDVSEQKTYISISYWCFQPGIDKVEASWKNV